MDEEHSSLYKIIVGVVCLLAFVFVFRELGRGLWSIEMPIKLVFLVIIGVMGLFVTLALVAVTYSLADLTDETQALGLPEGSVRAVIALSLIVIFAIFAIYLHQSLLSAEPDSPANDFAKQVFTFISTLVTSVSSYYFAARAASTTAALPRSSPTLVSVAPNQTNIGSDSVILPLKISGTGLQLAKTVRLEMAGGKAFQADDVTSNDQYVNCQIKFDKTAVPGKYDVIVANSDGASAKLPAAFQIIGPGAS